MIKKLLVSFVMLMVVSVSYAVDFKYQWCHTIYGKTKAGNIPVAVIKTTDGNYVAFSSFGSNTRTGTKVYFDGSELKDADGQDIEGCQYAGNNDNSVNHNLLLQKFDSETGGVMWTVYSDKGDLYNNQAVYPTADGGLVLVSDVRNLADKAETTLFRMVGADNQKTEVSYTPAGDDHSSTEGVIAKIDKDGKVEWAKLIATTTHPMVNEKTFGGYAIYYKGVVVDSKGNIYVCGNYMSEVKFVKRDGTEETHQAKNTGAWDGSIQTSAGDPFIAKLDQDGYLLKFMTEDESNISFASFDKMTINDDVIYVSGRFKGDGSGSIKFGDTTLQPNDCWNLIYASVNAEDLSLNYMKMLVAGKFDGKNYAVQNMNLQYYNGSLYMTGLITGSLADDNSSTPFISTTTKMREAMIVKVNAQDGKRLAAGIDGKSITAAYGVVETKDPSTVWAYGYSLLSMARLNKYTLEGDKLVKGTEQIALNEATVGMLGKPLIDGTNLIAMGRARYNSGTVLGTTDKTDFLNWGIVLSKHTCDDILDPAGTATSVEGLTVQKDSVPNYDVYSVAGMLVKRAKSMSEATDALPSGLYVIGGRKVVVR